MYILTCKGDNLQYLLRMYLYILLFLYMPIYMDILICDVFINIYLTKFY